VVPTDLDTTPKTAIRRKPERGCYDRATVDAILDEAFVAHVGIAVDGQPFVIPMACARASDQVLLHGSVASRLLRALDHGARVCVTCTLVDGLVLAHSYRNHSINYRSVVVLGTATRLRDEPARAALARIVDHIVPGRAGEARPASDEDLRDTMVLTVPIEEASAKVRTGPPAPSSDEDRAVPRWAGVVPVALVPGVPIPTEDSRELPTPASVSSWRRPG
jgi:nitroimidazol reductase NimA-like FMN-containing flavoprotein (pyridoxamine 5'-phosphate oxidase superfamily)